MPNIKIKTSDNEIFDVDVQIAKCAVVLKTMMEDCGMGVIENDVVPLPLVNSTIFRKILQWANYHKNDPQPTNDDEIKEKSFDDISSWDADFLKVDKETLFQLITAANYLDIKGLFDIACKAVANMINVMAIEEIRTLFNIKNDFTPEEEKQVRQENEWVCESED